jgi:hypothetical protein
MGFFPKTMHKVGQKYIETENHENKNAPSEIVSINCVAV